MATSYLTPGVYVEEVPAKSGTLSAGATAVAAFVGFTEKYPTDDPKDPDGLKPRLVTNWTQFTTLYGGFVDGAMLPHSVYAYFNNGGSMAYIVRIPNRGQSPDPATVAIKSADRSLGPVVEFTAKDPAAKLDITVEKEPPKPALTDGKADPKAKGDAKAEAAEPAEDPTPTFRLVIHEAGDPKKVVKEYSGVTLTNGEASLVKVIAADKDAPVLAAYIEEADSKLIPELASIDPGTYPMMHKPGAPVPVRFGDFQGSAEERRGIDGLALAEDVTMVMIPDLITACVPLQDGKPDYTADPDLNKWKAVQVALINHCENHGNRMAILDSPPRLNPQQMREWRQSAGYSSAFAAVYYPWVKVANPIGKNGDAEIYVPPSGHVAGIWARNDDTRGVWKAPANEVVRGALDVQVDMTKAEQGILNPEGVNCIRSFGSRGIRVWGARTLADPSGEWRYVNVRRLFNMVESAILEGTQFAVFEPNDVKLWEGLKRTVGSFLLGLWRDGALFGATAEQAFYVKCDSETNPPESIDEGKVVVEVGIAPVKPAEFVIFRISQIKQSST